MAGISGNLTGMVLTRLQAPDDGVNVRLATLEKFDDSLATQGVRSMEALFASVDLVEKHGIAHYPALLVYCDKLSNSLKEKFRRFSGKAHMVIEVRHSEDLLHSVETNTQALADAVCALLDDSRGDWGAGAFYSGGYDVVFEPVVRGGKNFLQRAKVGFDVDISR